MNVQTLNIKIRNNINVDQRTLFLWNQRREYGNTRISYRGHYKLCNRHDGLSNVNIYGVCLVRKQGVACFEEITIICVMVNEAKRRSYSKKFEHASRIHNALWVNTMPFLNY